VRLAGRAPVESGPVIILGNHPNMALDSLIIASVYERELWFLGKATLFQNPLVAAILDKLHVIPVERRQDSPSDTVQNDEMFRRAAAVLEAGRGLALFPEGVSRGERKLAPLKTGAARIAFQAESPRNFSGGLVLQPVGITYSDLHAFRSSVTVTFGEPIKAADFADDFAADAIGTVRALTARCQAELEAVTVEISLIEHQALIEKIARLYRSSGSTLDERARLGLIAQNVEALAPRYPERADELKRRIDDYLAVAGMFAIEGDAPLEEERAALPTLLVLPLVFLGVVTHFLPYQAIGTLARRAAEPVTLASLKLGLGAVIFPVWYLCIGAVVVAVSGSWWWGAFAVILTVLSGYGANHYLHATRLFLLSTLWPGKRKPVEVVRILRDDIIAELERLRIA
jgi:1-acyl-sn-glycerol-3-phosphate acyltransferase